MFCILFEASISEKHETRQVFIKHYCVTLIKKKLSSKVCKQIIYNMWKQNLKQTLSMKET